ARCESRSGYLARADFRAWKRCLRCGRTIARRMEGRYLIPPESPDAVNAKRRPMPELPEVETVRRGLAEVMEDARILGVEARRPDLRWPLPADFVRRLTGTTVTSLGRRAKY